MTVATRRSKVSINFTITIIQYTNFKIGRKKLDTKEFMNKDAARGKKSHTVKKTQNTDFFGDDDNDFDWDNDKVKFIH